MKRPTRDVFQGMGYRRWETSKEQYHRIGGPAIEQDDGDKVWINHGKIIYGQFNDGVFKWYEVPPGQSHWARVINNTLKFRGYEEQT